MVRITDSHSVGPGSIPGIVIACCCSEGTVLGRCNECSARSPRILHFGLPGGRKEDEEVLYFETAPTSFAHEKANFLLVSYDEQAMTAAARTIRYALSHRKHDLATHRTFCSPKQIGDRHHRQSFGG